MTTIFDVLARRPSVPTRKRMQKPENRAVLQSCDASRVVDYSAKLGRRRDVGDVDLFTVLPTI
jgi:hypothetical protein